MKVIDPNDTAHSIIVIPRDYTFSVSINLEIFDETTQVRQVVAITNFATSNGYTTINFTDAQYTNVDFYEDGKYQLKVTFGSEVIYRGKMIATSQVPQEYKLTNGLYSYE